jgi:hypothetical protein
MTRVQYEWTAKDNKTKVVVNTLEEARALKEKFNGNYKVKYTEGLSDKEAFAEKR